MLSGVVLHADMATHPIHTHTHTQLLLWLLLPGLAPTLLWSHTSVRWGMTWRCKVRQMPRTPWVTATMAMVMVAPQTTALRMRAQVPHRAALERSAPVRRTTTLVRVWTREAQRQSDCEQTTRTMARVTPMPTSNPTLPLRPKSRLLMLGAPQPPSTPRPWTRRRVSRRMQHR